MHNAPTVAIAEEEVSGVKDTSLTEEYVITNFDTTRRAPYNEESSIPPESDCCKTYRVSKGKLYIRMLFMVQRTVRFSTPPFSR